MREYKPEEEAVQIFRTAHSLKTLWDSINAADGYGDLITARRMCELVLADEIKSLNFTLGYIKERFPDIEIEGYDPVEVPCLAITDRQGAPTPCQS